MRIPESESSMTAKSHNESFHSSSDLSRRQFLTRTGQTLAALTAANLLLTGRAHGDDAPVKVYVGSGQHKYEWLSDWLTPPDNIHWGDTQGVTQDARGNIYVTHTVAGDSPSKDAIVVFDKNGKFVTSWGSRFAGGGHGIDIRKEEGQEYLYHCDTAHRVVVKTTLSGDVIWEKGVPQEPGVYKDKARFVPTNVCFAPNGDFYIADGYGSSYIHQYDIKGNWIRTFAGPGTELGKCHTPHGLWLDMRGKEPLLAVLDRENSRLQYFSLDGKGVSIVKDQMRRPCNSDIRKGEMVIPDLASVVTILDKDNKVAALLGDGADVKDLRGHPRSEFIPGKFIHPHDAMYLHNGDILVAEWMPTGRITLLKRVKG